MSDTSSLTAEEALKQASANRDAGDVEAAERLYRSVLRDDPRNAQAQKELHKLLKGKKKPAAKGRRQPKQKQRPAKKSQQTVTVVQPPGEELDGLVALYQAGRWSDTETRAKQLLKKYPSATIVLDILGTVLSRQGQFDDAADAYRRILALTPDHAEAHSNLGNALKELGRFDEAIGSFQRALEINPRLAGAQCNLGSALKSLGRLDEAVSCFRQALSIDPTFAEAHNNLGNALKDLGQFDEAIACYRKALKVRPDFAMAYNNLGNLYEKTNDVEKARECTKKARDLNPGSPGINLSWAVLLRREGKTKEAIQVLEPFAAAAIPYRSLIPIHNELGKLYDREKNSQKAFQHFSRANELHAHSQIARSFSKDAFLAAVKQAEALLGSGWIDTRQTAPQDQPIEAPAFIVGFPRSGTTLLDQILDSHPGIQVMEEKPVISGIAERIKTAFGPYPSALAELRPTDLQELRDSYFARVQEHLTREPDTLLVDKLPLNICQIPLISQLFPDAKIIVALRHPCDVVLSNFMQYFQLNDAMANFFTVADAAHCYAQVMGLWQKCAQQLPLNYRTLKYESLVADFEGEVRTLLEFLDLPWDEAVLHYSDHASQRGAINTPSYQAVTEPINRRAMFRWKRYEEQLRPAFGELAPFIESFGYSGTEAQAS